MRSEPVTADELAGVFGEVSPVLRNQRLSEWCESRGVSVEALAFVATLFGLSHQLAESQPATLAVTAFMAGWDACGIFGAGELEAPA